MEYFILCFGRTDFTKATVDSILANATQKPSIYLINNGWNEKIVPDAILGYWRHFTSEYKESGKIVDVIEVPVAMGSVALDSLEIAQSMAQGEYYWISDNDCIIASPGFDESCLELMNTYPELPKLGIDFYRIVSFEYCDRFASYIPGYEFYIRALVPSYNRIIEGNPVGYTECTGEEKLYYRGDTRVCSSLSDTTLSIVRKGCAISQRNNRISLSASAFEMLHVGYLEPAYRPFGDQALFEMLHYMNLRPHVLTEFKDDYEERKMRYISNLIQHGMVSKIQRYNELIGR